jgi:3-oxoacyl-[acyl-carrier protein] reductase
MKTHSEISAMPQMSVPGLSSPESLSSLEGLFSLQGEVALVTGASSGLGARFARVLAAAGASVVLAARRKDRLDALADEINGSGGRACSVVMDVCDAQSVAHGFDAAQAAFGLVTIAVANAGIASTGRALATDDAAWRAVLDVDLDGVFRVCREAGQRLSHAGRGGSLITIASVLGLAPSKGLAAYATAKAGVIQLTKALALELAPANIRVNALAPGYCRTDINSEFLDSPAGDKLRARIAMNRFGEAGDLDGAMLLLASGASRFMTGSVIVVDGGHSVAL